MELFRKWMLVMVCGFLLAAVAHRVAQAQDKPALALTAEQLEKVTKANNECLTCHSEAGVAHPPKEGLDLTKLRGLLKDTEAFKGSDHRQLACTKCHNEGYDEHPHAPDASDSTTTCSDCHAKKATMVDSQFEKSVHAKNLTDTFTCTTCHDPHVMRLSSKMEDAHKIVAQDNRVCLNCHDSDEKFAKFAPGKKSRPLIDDIHDWLPNTRLHWTSVRCVECHTPAVANNEPLSHEILNKDKAEKNCISCHSSDSSLKSRLYRHLVSEERQRLGFANSVILSNSYVLGATRHPILDTIVLGAFAAMIIGLLAHGIGRVLVSFLRRREDRD